MRVLFVENEDSFSWNVVDALPVRREAIDVRLGADPGAVRAGLASADVLVIGPGPTDPARAGLIDLVTEAAARRMPMLGVCLGHQALGLAFGARLERAVPCHGKRATVTFGPSRLFPDLRGPLVAMRYHSLALADVRAPLRTIATTGGLVMAVEHESLPMAGVQFHPDSYGTPRGRELFASFFAAISGGQR